MNDSDVTFSVRCLYCSMGIYISTGSSDVHMFCLLTVASEKLVKSPKWGLNVRGSGGLERPTGVHRKSYVSPVFSEILLFRREKSVGGRCVKRKVASPKEVEQDLCLHP